MNKVKDVGIKVRYSSGQVAESVGRMSIKDGVGSGNPCDNALFHPTLYSGARFAPFWVSNTKTIMGMEIINDGRK